MTDLAKHHPGPSIGRIVVGVVVGCLVLLFLAVTLLLVPIMQLTWALAVGWVNSSIRLMETVGRDATALIGPAVLCGLVVAGFHALFRWLAANRGDGVSLRWRGAWTAAILGVLISSMWVGMGLVGMAHQFAWLARRDNPVFVERSGMSMIADASAVDSAVERVMQEQGTTSLESLSRPGLRPYLRDRRADALNRKYRIYVLLDAEDDHVGVLLIRRGPERASRPWAQVLDESGFNRFTAVEFEAWFRKFEGRMLSLVL